MWSRFLASNRDTRSWRHTQLGLRSKESEISEAHAGEKLMLATTELMLHDAARARGWRVGGAGGGLPSTLLRDTPT